jgi:hypothetical protein
MHPDGMGWSWPEFQATPPYVRQMCWAFLVKQRRAEAERSERAQRAAAHAQDGKTHVEY